MKSVLIASPVRQKPAILGEFLTSIKELKRDQAKVDYLFIDDNDEQASHQLLTQFKEEHENTMVWDWEDQKPYLCDEMTHHWNEELIWKVAAMKDRMLEYVLKEGYDAIFLIDSDLVLHPGTLEQLLLADKDIISNIFWTRWKPDDMEMPQVWLQDTYTLYRKGRNEVITGQEAMQRILQFFRQLRVPGVYEVGGLGACTMIRREAIEVGVRFAEIKNLSFQGEDRHFCIRAAALGLSLYVDTHFPAYHIYRESDLEGVADYKNKAHISSQKR
ncbi:glycosyltransferase family 2 protein [Rossellomorea yichunensis]|uniref:glycosyltransferase family 2 protein n=1 Tax=Rossellomorea yichunensis TaxID=3077331 RepID=UPI0028DEF580|nr:glycosyltransferase family 2 protein [Rossellomorea sp. YC4-1]MDT9027891.1 glycosyltransferase family 2 protein [Rossellomorea sp. YC4-1]